MGKNTGYVNDIHVCGLYSNKKREKKANPPKQQQQQQQKTNKQTNWKLKPAVTTG